MAETSPVVVSLEDLAREPYSFAIAYPSRDENSVQTRIHQLGQLGVTSIVFDGPLKMDRFSLLGKGVAGMVAVGVIGRKKVALKIRRVDSRRKDMVHESRMLQAANTIGVGPRYIGSTRDILAMELVEGERIPAWLQGLKGRGRKSRVRKVVRTLLEQCRWLDVEGLDHGELSRATKNVLVGTGDVPWIVDFESASSARRAANVTSLAQYLFLGGGFSRKMARVLGPKDRDRVMNCLRSYKASSSNADFDSVLEVLEL